MNSHSNEFHANGSCYNKLNWVIALKSEDMRSCEEDHTERNEAKDDFHAFEDFLPEQRDFNIIFEFRIQLKVG